MSVTQEVLVSYPDFLNELTNEFQYMKNGGTSYRKDTVELSLKVAKEVKNVTPFFNRDVAFETVSEFLPGMDVDRLKDIAKMLNVVLRDLHSKANRSDELKSKLLERARNRKPFRLVPVQ